MSDSLRGDCLLIGGEGACRTHSGGIVSSSGGGEGACRTHSGGANLVHLCHVSVLLARLLAEPVKME